MTNEETKLPPLHQAVEDGDIAEVKRLIDGRADVNEKDNEGFTPLHYAAWNGQTDIVNALVKAKAEVNAKTKKCLTPLHFAALAGQSQIVVILVKAGADSYERDNNGDMPLDIARRKYGKDSRIANTLDAMMIMQSEG